MPQKISSDESKPLIITNPDQQKKVEKKILPFSFSFTDILKYIARKIYRACGGNFGFRTLSLPQRSTPRANIPPPSGYNSANIANAAAQSVRKKSSSHLSEVGEHVKEEHIKELKEKLKERSSGADSYDAAKESGEKVATDLQDANLGDGPVQVEGRQPPQVVPEKLEPAATIQEQEESGKEEVSNDRGVEAHPQPAQEKLSHTQVLTEAVHEGLEVKGEDAIVRQAPGTQVSPGSAEVLPQPVEDEISVKGAILDISQKQSRDLVCAYIEVLNNIKAAKEIVDGLGNKQVDEIIKEAIGPGNEANYQAIKQLFLEQLKVMKEMEKVSEKYNSRKSITGADIDMAAECIKKLVAINSRFRVFLSHLIEMQLKVNDAVGRLDPKMKINTQKGEEFLGNFISNAFIVLAKRVAQFPLTLKEISKNTPESYASRTVILRALEEATDVAKIVNESGRGEELLVLKKNKLENKKRLQAIRSMLVSLESFNKQNNLIHASEDRKKSATLKQQWRAENPIMAKIADFNETPFTPDSFIMDAYFEFVLEPQKTSVTQTQQISKPRTPLESLRWYAIALNLSDQGFEKAKEVFKKLRQEKETKGSLSVDDANKLKVFEELINIRSMLLKGEL